MKYSSQEGRLENFLVACAIRSTGLFLAALMVLRRGLWTRGGSRAIFHR
jgi:hypothetical protein